MLSCGMAVVARPEWVVVVGVRVISGFPPPIQSTHARKMEPTDSGPVLAVWAVIPIHVCRLTRILSAKQKKGGKMKKKHLCTENSF